MPLPKPKIDLSKENLTPDQMGQVANAIVALNKLILSGVQDQDVIDADFKINSWFDDYLDNKGLTRDDVLPPERSKNLLWK